MHMHTLLNWLSSQMQPKYSTALFTISDVGFQQDCCYGLH